MISSAGKNNAVFRSGRHSGESVSNKENSYLFENNQTKRLSNY